MDKLEIMKTIFITISMLLSLNSCSDKTEEHQFISQDLQFDVIYNGSLSGSGSEGVSKSNMIIDNEIDWKNLMMKMDSYNQLTGNFSETDINFNDYLIIAVFLEVKGNGWEVEITKITEEENKLIVSKNETMFVTSVITQPFSIVKILKNKKPIEFKDYND